LTGIDKWPVMHPILSEENIEMYKNGWPGGSCFSRDTGSWFSQFL
jgi:hypothetical protein